MGIAEASQFGSRQECGMADLVSQSDNIHHPPHISEVPDIHATLTRCKGSWHKKHMLHHLLASYQEAHLDTTIDSETPHNFRIDQMVALFPGSTPQFKS